jgi:hypothetical protein
VVAVARKLAVLLHRIWITQEVYMPFESGLDYFGALLRNYDGARTVS